MLQKLFIGMVFTALLSAQAAAPSVFNPFAGKWTGNLEYQDYAGSGRVKIPVKLEVKPSNANSAIWDFVYDDFGRAVPSLETHVWQKGNYTVRTQGKSEVERYTSFDFDYLVKSGVGTAILFGSELDSGKTVEVRRTITLGKTMLTTLKETREVGKEFTFRNQSTYSRKSK